jgi:ADP-heptose:LPS heptosyltransferase
MLKDNLVLTIAIGDYHKKISKLTLPTIKAYAEKINCDFLCITDENPEYVTQKWNKFLIYQLLDKYKRILYFDIDIIIRNDTPNLFEIVPKNKLGMFNEGAYADRNELLSQASYYYNEPIKKHNGKFYNSGVMLIPRKYKSIFKIPNGFDEVKTDQPYINLRIQNDNVEMFDLDYKFNRMAILDSFCGKSRLDSYVVHYAGAPENQIIPVIENDIIKWNSDSPNYEYKMNILISVTGGLGDQLCAKPVISYAQKLFDNANFYIVTHFPELFNDLNCYASTYDNWNGINDAILTLHSCPDISTSDHKLSHALFHAIDFAAMSMLKRAMPNEYKKINITVDEKDLNSVQSLINGYNKEKPIVLVHAGKWWASKTFPENWWQYIVDKLSENLTVVLIGKTIDDNQGYVPITCPKDGIDLRDATTIGELSALISISECLLTNDSSPLHIGGAFDNWIVVIPTCKHPDSILPYRNCNQQYKVKSLYKKLLVDDLETRFTETDISTIDLIPKNKSILDYIPNTDLVISEVLSIYKKSQ